TQETPIEVSSDATTSQQESNNVVDWNYLRTSDLKVMCFRCSLRTDGSKTELVNRLEAFWSEHEPELEPEKDGSNRNRNRVLDRSLQQWMAKVNGFGAIETSFPKKKFRRAQDQYEYDLERLRLRAFTLRVAKEEGWTVAKKIPKTVPNEGDEFKNLLVEARKQANYNKGFPYHTIKGLGKPKRKVHFIYSVYSSHAASTTSLESQCVPEPGPNLSGLAEGSTRGSRFFQNKTNDE
ncbi:4627_t:CDS:2, partial [Gigaspora rosea]